MPLKLLTFSLTSKNVRYNQTIQNKGTKKLNKIEYET